MLARRTYSISPSEGKKTMALDPLSTLTAVSTVLNIVDKVAAQIQRFRKKESEPAAEKPHEVVAQKEDGKILVKREGKVVEQITAADLQKLDENSRALIGALEQSMQKKFKLWTVVYPQRDTSPDPLRNAQVEEQLNDLAKGMCSDLGKIFRYLDRIEKYLEDHYQHVRAVCGELSEG
jgi:hypothetical protein